MRVEDRQSVGWSPNVAPALSGIGVSAVTEDCLMGTASPLHATAFGSPLMPDADTETRLLRDRVSARKGSNVVRGHPCPHLTFLQVGNFPIRTLFQR